MQHIRAAIYSHRHRRSQPTDGKLGKLEIVAFPSECSKCNREINAERFGCGWDDRYKGKGKLSHTWDPDWKTCPRYSLESNPDVTMLLHDMEDYRRGALGPVGALPAPLVDYLRFADSVQNKWADDGQG